MRDDPGGRFASDEHRRVAGNLGQPRSVVALNAALRADTSVSISGSDLTDVLKDLEADGLVKVLGDFTDADAYADALKDDDAVIHFPAAQVKVLRARADAQPSVYLDGEQWVLTTAGLKALEADAPNPPPPLTGDALKAADDQDKARGVGAYAEEA